jgi:rhodanese-related sulfurtransferase
MKKFLTFCGAALFAAAVYAGEYADITISELKSAMTSKNVTLLDANGSQSYQKAHIPGAIDFTAHESDLSNVLPKDKNALIVAYCGNPQCKAYQGAAKAAANLGYKNIKHLPAGIQGWKQAKEPTEHSVASK